MEVDASLISDDEESEKNDQMEMETDSDELTVKLKKECTRSFTSTVTISLGQADRRLPPDLLFGCQARPTIGDLSS